MNGNVNQAIKCTVQQCKHHAAGQNYCSLREILVGTHEGNPTESQCTDCKLPRCRNRTRRSGRQRG